MADKIDIVLIVDHKWRDLPGMASLAVWLEGKFNLKTKLIPYSQWQQSMIQDRPGVLVVSILYGERGKAILNLAHETGTKVAVIMTEGRPNTTQSMAYSVGKDSGLSGADLCFVWSETVRDFILQQDILPSEKIKVAGAHRFDIYMPHLNKLIMPREKFAAKYGLDNKKPIISWATNFTHADFHVRNQDFMIKNWKDIGVSKYPAYSDPMSVAKNDWETRKLSCDIMRKLLASKKDIQLAVKPHPAENHVYYEQFVDSCRQDFGPRIVFIGFEYIWDLLNAANVHIHRLCTTGVEAWFLDVPSIDLHLRDYAPWSLELPGAASEAVQGNDVVKDLDTLIERIDYYLQGGKPASEQLRSREQYIKRWLFKIDGQRCEEHAGILADLLKKCGTVRRPKLNRANIPIYTKGLITELLGPKAGVKLRSWNKSKNGIVDKIGQVDKIISEEDAQKWINLAKNALYDNMLLNKHKD